MTDDKIGNDREKTGKVKKKDSDRRQSRAGKRDTRQRISSEAKSGKSTDDNGKELQDFPVIGIGASAGGLESFSKFFENMPVDSEMAFVLIQHLDPTHTSNMVELLRRYTRMPVYEAQDGMKLETNHVYMIPPNRNMTITDRTLTLVEQLERPGISHSVDLFFRSLASDLKEKAICIILSGTGSDGSIGAKAVKAEMGMVMVQDPETSRYDGMPRAAIASGVADFVLPVEEMPKRLIDYVAQYYGKRILRGEAAGEEITSLAQVLSLIRARTKHDFSGYKPSTINRRIERRMGLNQIDNINDYLKFLREHPPEVAALVRDFLINVTSFFRDPEAFDILKRELKKLLAFKVEGSEVRAWITGCSTGEEAYSIAIIIEEVMEELKRYFHVQVFGTDLDHEAIAVARIGSYPASIAADVGPERLKSYFVRNDDQYQIKRDLREKLIFAVQDIIADPPFTKMDLISARNLLIYFDAGLQKRLVPMFHYALNENGLLFLGTAETVGEFTELFTVVDRKWKLFRTERKEKYPPYPFPEHTAWREPALPKLDEFTRVKPQIGVRLPEHLLLEALPPSLLIDSSYQVIYTHGDTHKYLGLPEGKLRADILDMVRPELRSFVISGLREALSSGKNVVRDGARLKNNGESLNVRILIKPIAPIRIGETPGQLIVTFQDLPRPRRSKGGASQADAERLRELEQELQFTKETLRGTIEELETANEELRSANEEYQSTNEELQSTNEELETSREELQSVNEELTTVNTEHQRKIEELSTINDDMKNLLNSTGVATIFLGTDLKLQRFTPAATQIFNFIETDVGRPLSDITTRLEIDNLPFLAGRVLETLVPVKEDVQTKDGKRYSMRIHPYRTTENAIAGVGISFIDISEQERIRAALSFAQAIINTLRHPVIVLDRELNVVSANKSFYQTFQLTPEETEKKRLYDLGNRQWNIPQLRKLLEDILPGKSELENYPLEYDFPLVGRRKMILNARHIGDEDGADQRILLAIEDTTEKQTRRAGRGGQ